MKNRLVAAQKRLSELQAWVNNLEQHIATEGVRKIKHYVPYPGTSKLDKTRTFDSLADAVAYLANKVSHNLKQAQRDVWIEEFIDTFVRGIEAEVMQETVLHSGVPPIQVEAIAWAIPLAEEGMEQSLDKLHIGLHTLCLAVDTKEAFHNAIAMAKDMLVDGAIPDTWNFDRHRANIRIWVQRLAGFKALQA